MTALSDFVTVFGPAGTPAVAAAAAFGIFEFLDKIASNDAKAALKHALQTLDVNKAASLPQGTIGLFQRIFGPRHFSIKCFVRSVCFSMAAVIFLLGIAFLLRGDELIAEWHFYREEPARYTWSLWVIISALLDYVSLYKTRVILQLVGNHKFNWGGLIGIAVLDLIIGFAIFFTLYNTAFHLLFALATDESATEAFRSLLAEFGRFFASFYHYLSFDSFESALFYASMVPSMWLWLYVLAIFVTRSALHGERFLNWVRWSST